MFLKTILLVTFFLLFSGIFLSKNISEVGNNTFKKNETLNLKKIPSFYGPFSFDEKGKAALAISKIYCKNKKAVSIKDQNKEDLIIKELSKNDLPINLRKSVEVLRAANKVSELLDENCNLNSKKKSEKELIFKQYFIYN